MGTVQGGIITGSYQNTPQRNNEYFINDVRIGDYVDAISASNGAVIKIGSVLTAPPLPSKTIAEIAIATPDLSTLVTAVVAADLVSLFNGTGPFTLFAPTNEAFAALPPGTLSNLLLPQNKVQLVQLLAYHAVSGSFHAKDFVNGQMLKTVEGQNVTVTLSSSSVDINKAMVVTADIGATNGVIHLINGVLIPSDVKGNYEELAPFADCTESSETACDADSKCTWCKSEAVPSSCHTLADAKTLPPGVFVCDASIGNA